jgi:hypothetical protein
MSMREQLLSTAAHSRPRIESDTKPREKQSAKRLADEAKRRSQNNKKGEITEVEVKRREDRSSSPRRHHLDKRACDLAESGGGDPGDLLSTKQVAAWLGVSPEWVEIGRHQRYGPKFLRLGPNVIRYRRGDVIAWLRERTFQSTDEYESAPRGRGRAR